MSFAMPIVPMQANALKIPRSGYDDRKSMLAGSRSGILTTAKRASSDSENCPSGFGANFFVRVEKERAVR